MSLPGAPWGNRGSVRGQVCTGLSPRTLVRLPSWVLTQTWLRPTGVWIWGVSRLLVCQQCRLMCLVLLSCWSCTGCSGCLEPGWYPLPSPFPLVLSRWPCLLPHSSHQLCFSASRCSSALYFLLSFPVPPERKWPSSFLDPDTNYTVQCSLEIKQGLWTQTAWFQSGYHYFLETLDQVPQTCFLTYNMGTIVRPTPWHWYGD